MGIKELWVKHGTKLIGFGTAAVGTLAILDKQTIDLIGQMVGPQNEHVVTRGLMTLAGLATAYRGFSNSQPKDPTP